MKDTRSLLIFTILLLIFIVVLAVALRTAPSEYVPQDYEGTAGSYAYESTRASIKSAIGNHYNIEGDLPVMNATVGVGGGYYHMVDVCALVMHELELLSHVPSSCAQVAGAGNDNCDGGQCVCREYAHYVWLVDDFGEVHSVCVGDDCDANNKDGYQGVWP